MIYRESELADGWSDGPAEEAKRDQRRRASADKLKGD